MYIGHLGAGLWAKGRDAATPLWLLLFAAFGPDWVELVSMALKIPDTSLHSHGLPVALFGLLGFIALAWLVTRSPRQTQLTALVYLSHIALDFLTGIKPTWPGGPKLGLHWYARPLVDFIAESVVIVLGWFFYRRSVPLEANRRVSLYALLVLLVALQGFFDWKFIQS